jgi:hypothetical protein
LAKNLTTSVWLSNRYVVPIISCSFFTCTNTRCVLAVANGLNKLQIKNCN